MTAPDRYTHGHHPSVVGQHARRTAERDAAYLLPHLKPGMRLLDVGCGPGTITTGLARAVSPGETVGIDVVEGVIATARELTADAGLTNLTLRTGDVYALDPADTFDAVHAHQVLQHLSRPVDALRSIHGCLRPGGVVGVRDADYATMTAYPGSPALENWLEVYHAVARRNSAEADAGRRLPSWLQAAGFVEITTTATAVIFADPDSVANWGESWAERALHSAFAQQAVEYGLATRSDLEEISGAWRAWVREPDACFFYVNVECVGRKP